MLDICVDDHREEYKHWTLLLMKCECVVKHEHFTEECYPQEGHSGSVLKVQVTCTVSFCFISKDNRKECKSCKKIHFWSIMDL